MAERLICLDTSVLIDYFRKTKKENSFLYELAEQYENFAVSAITEFEIYSGITEAQREFWGHFFRNVSILPFTSNTGRLAAEIFQDLRRQNKLIEMPDILIGATAIENEISLATLNEKDFSRINHLELLSR